MIGSLKNILSLFRDHKGRLVLSFLFAFLSIASKMAIPLLTGKAIDVLRSDFNFENLTPFLFAILGLLLSGALFRYIFDYLSNQLVEVALFDLRKKVYASFVEADLSTLEKRKQGDLLSTLLGDMDTLQRGMISGVVALYEGVVQILLTVAFMFTLSWLLSLAVILLTPISVLVSRFIAKRNANSFKRQNELLGEVSAFSLECLSNASTISEYGLWEKKEEEFKEKAKTLQKTNFSANFAASLINPSTRLVNNSIYAVLILIGVSLLIFQPPFSVGFTVGALSSFLTYAYQYMAPFNEVADASSDVIFASVASKRILDAIDMAKESKEGEEGPKEFEEIECKDLHFGYVPEKPILKGIDFQTKKGMKIALVGTTGCGKTTLLSLLMRFYDPSSGNFFVLGEPLNTYSIASVRRKEGVILQDAILMHGTVAENIAIGKRGATREEIVKAAKESGADEFIRYLPQGYDTPLHDRSGLSEGQKQLLNLARVLLLDRDLLLLDEATSHLDLLTETRLKEAFSKLCKGKTSIVVAHRLSTVADADMILVMDQGKIIESGTYSELIRKNGFFSELYRSQLG